MKKNKPKINKNKYMPSKYIKKYGDGGRLAKDIGAGLYGVGEGLLDTVTFGATDQFTDMGYKALQEAGGSTEAQKDQQNSINSFSKIGGAVAGGFLNPASTGTAIGQTSKGLSEGISYGSPDNEDAQNISAGIGMAGQLGSLAYGNMDASKAAQSMPKLKHGGMMGMKMYPDGGLSNSFSTYQLPESKFQYISEENTSQNNNNYTNKFEDYTKDTEINSGNINRGYNRSTNDPSKTPYIGYYNDKEATQLNIAGPNGSIYPKTDPFINNYLNNKIDTKLNQQKYGGIMKMYNGGTMKYPEGGQTFQVDAPSHEDGGQFINSPNGQYEIEKEEAVKIGPNSDKILSDNKMLKLFSTGKTPALSFKPLEIKKTKAEKILAENKNISKEQRNSLDLSIKTASKKFDLLFNEQEALKKLKSDNYNKRLGIAPQLEFRNGGIKKYRDAGNVPYEPLNFNQQSNLDFNSPYLNQNSFNLDPENDQRVASYDPNYNPYQKSLNNFDVTAGNQNTYMDNNTYQPKYNPYGNSLKPFSIDQNNKFMNAGSNPGTYKTKDNDTNTDNNKFPTEAFLSGLADNAGNFAYLANEGKKYDKVNYGAIAPKTIDFSEAIRQGNQDAANSRNNLKNIVGGNAGAYMANISQIQNANTMNKAKIIQEGENINAGIINQANMFNKQNEIQGMRDEAGNKGKALTNYYKAIEGIGRNTTQAFTDYKKGKMDTNTAKMLSQAFADFGLDMNKEGDYVLFYKKLQEQQRLGATSVSSPSSYNPSSTIPYDVNSYKGMNKFKLG